MRADAPVNRDEPAERIDRLYATSPLQPAGAEARDEDGAPAMQLEGRPVTDADLARRLLEPQIAATLERTRARGLLAG